MSANAHLKYSGHSRTPSPNKNFYRLESKKMEKYDYRKAVLEDVKNAFAEYPQIFAENTDRNDLESALHDALWIADSVTGNASGSYFCNTWKAEECIVHNWDLLLETAKEFGAEPTISCEWEHGAEWWDVSIRCYLLGEAISKALDEME